WIRAAKLSDQFRPCYTAVAAAGKRADRVARRVLTEVVEPLVAGTGRLVLAVDDTPTERYGPHVQGAGIHHNPTPGPAGRVTSGARPFTWPGTGAGRGAGSPGGAWSVTGGGHHKTGTKGPVAGTSPASELALAPWLASRPLAAQGAGVAFTVCSARRAGNADASSEMPLTLLQPDRSSDAAPCSCLNGCHPRPVNAYSGPDRSSPARGIRRQRGNGAAS